MQTTRYLLLGISILGWAEVSLAEPGWEDMFKAVTNGGDGSSQPDPKPAANPDPNKIAEIVKDGISLGENSNPHTSTSGKVDESSKPDTSIPDFTLNINEDETKPDTSTPDTTFNTTLDEIFELIMKKNSIMAKPADPTIKTKGSLSGGLLGTLVYIFHAIQYVWKILKDTIIFKAMVTFYNAEYITFGEAIRHDDGLLGVTVPIYIGGEDNPLGKKFVEKMKMIERPGDSVTIQSYFTYAFFKTFQEDATFTSFQGSWYDLSTDEYYSNTTIIQLPLKRKENFMSKNQFEMSFGRLSDTSGNPITDNMPHTNDQSSTPPTTSSGIEVNPV